MVLSLYEYQILVSLLEGSINTLNGLGWYHGVVLEDHRNAVKYFEQAALNGSADAMFNLGIYDINGKNPYSPFDSCQNSFAFYMIYFLHKPQMAAFQLFLNASHFGHGSA